MIGCGIVGNSLAHHLDATRAGRDVVLLDKGPLPNPGGSTGHASNFIFLVDHSKEMTQLTLESVRQYRELGVLTECGGIEVARTEERMEELRRRMASAKAGVSSRSRSSRPAEIKELVPYIDESILLGGFYTPGVGVVDSLRAGTLMRERGRSSPARSRSSRTPRCTGLRRRGRPDPAASHTSRGDDRGRDGGDRLRRLEPAARRDGGRVTSRSRPMVHQMIDVGPVPRFEQTHEGDRVPDRPRHGRLHVRAPGRRRARDRLVRAPLDPPRPRGDPVDRGRGAVADGVPVHAGGLRPADGRMRST